MALPRCPDDPQLKAYARSSVPPPVPSLHVTFQHQCNNRHIPWSLFKQPFLDPKVSPPWKVWRGNFYRYDYPFRAAGPGFNHSRHELTAWSPTHSGNFHTPARFGVIELV